MGHKRHHLGGHRVGPDRRTPDTFVFDGERRLVYRGQLDDSSSRNDLPVTAADVRAAVDAVLAGRPVDPDQLPSIRVRHQVALSRAHADGTS